MQDNKTPKGPGRPQTLPATDTPMAAFIRDYQGKYGIMLAISTIAEKMGTTPRTVMRWRDGMRAMGGPALVALTSLRREYSLQDISPK